MTDDDPREVPAPGAGARVAVDQPGEGARAVPTLRALRRSDLGAFVRHLARQVRESGRHGLPHFAPRLEIDPDETRATLERRLATPLDEPDWGRTFVLVVPEPDPPGGERVVGHVDLRGGRLRAELHRGLLGLAIERSHHRRGHGFALMERVISFARDEAMLTWIDLFVFDENAPARALYRRLGFEERGAVEDAFRLPDGAVVGDVRMVLKLR